MVNPNFSTLVEGTGISYVVLCVLLCACSSMYVVCMYYV